MALLPKLGHYPLVLSCKTDDIAAPYREMGKLQIFLFENMPRDPNIGPLGKAILKRMAELSDDEGRVKEYANIIFAGLPPELDQRSVYPVFELLMDKKIIVADMKPNEKKHFYRLHLPGAIEPQSIRRGFSDRYYNQRRALQKIIDISERPLPDKQTAIDTLKEIRELAQSQMDVLEPKAAAQLAIYGGVI